MKKFLALLLAVVMVMAMSTTAFATGGSEEINADNTSTNIEVTGTYRETTDESEFVAADLYWDSMNFTYESAGRRWDPGTMTYEDTEAGWVEDEVKTITISNRSNVPLHTDFTYYRGTEADYDFLNIWSDNAYGVLIPMANAGTDEEAGTAYEVVHYVKVHSATTYVPSVDEQEAGTFAMGHITVTISAYPLVEEYNVADLVVESEPDMYGGFGNHGMYGKVNDPMVIYLTDTNGEETLVVNEIRVSGSEGSLVEDEDYTLVYEDDTIVFTMLKTSGEGGSEDEGNYYWYDGTVFVTLILGGDRTNQNWTANITVYP